MGTFSSGFTHEAGHLISNSVTRLKWDISGCESIALRRQPRLPRCRSVASGPSGTRIQPGSAPGGVGTFISGFTHEPGHLTATSDLTFRTQWCCAASACLTGPRGSGHVSCVPFFVMCVLSVSVCIFHVCAVSCVMGSSILHLNHFDIFLGSCVRVHVCVRAGAHVCFPSPVRRRSRFRPRTLIL